MKRKKTKEPTIKKEQAVEVESKPYLVGIVNQGNFSLTFKMLERSYIIQAGETLFFASALTSVLETAVSDLKNVQFIKKQL